MAIGTYLAMTAAEFEGCDSLPRNLAWMACHFSPYGTGLSNLPISLPENSMIIINDVTPAHRHDPKTVTNQVLSLVQKFKANGVLLDFQRPANDLSLTIADMLCKTLPCPTGVSVQYAKELKCPVFLPICPVHMPLEAYIGPWIEREIWMELGLEEREIRIDETGASISPYQSPGKTETGFQDQALCCHYTAKSNPELITVTLWRNQEDLKLLLAETERLGITKAIGLYQELKHIP